MLDENGNPDVDQVRLTYYVQIIVYLSRVSPRKILGLLDKRKILAKGYTRNPQDTLDERGGRDHP